jgi:hypothetical protein
MISLFREKRIDDLFRIVLRNIQEHIAQINEKQLLEENSLSLAKKVADRFYVKPLTIDFEKKDVKVMMVNLPWNAFPPDYDVTRGNSYSCAKVLYTIQINGDLELLNAKPNESSLYRPIKADVTENAFTIEYQTLYGNSELSEEIRLEVKRNAKQDIDSIKNLVPILNKEVKVFNDGLENKAFEIIEKRKISIKNKGDQNLDLNDL